MPRSYPSHEQGSWGGDTPTLAGHWLRAPLPEVRRGVSNCHSLSALTVLLGTKERLQAEPQIPQLEVQPSALAGRAWRDSQVLTAPAAGDGAAISRAY